MKRYLIIEQADADKITSAWKELRDLEVTLRNIGHPEVADQVEDVRARLGSVATREQVETDTQAARKVVMDRLIRTIRGDSTDADAIAAAGLLLPLLKD